MLKNEEEAIANTVRLTFLSLHIIATKADSLMFQLEAHVESYGSSTSNSEEDCSFHDDCFGEPEVILASIDANNPSTNVQQWSDSPSAVTHADQSSLSNQGNGFMGMKAFHLKLLKWVISGCFRARYHFDILLSFASIGFNAISQQTGVLMIPNLKLCHAHY